MHNLDTFGKRLRALRQLHQLTQDEMARRCGWREGTARGQGRISHYEADRRRPTLDDAELLANLLHTTIDYLMRGEHKEFKTNWRSLPMHSWENLTTTPKGNFSMPVTATTRVSAATFAVAVGTTAEPFHRGDIIVVDPKRKIKNDDFVLLTQHGKTAIGRVRANGRKLLIRILPDREVDAGYVLFGVIVGRYENY